MDSPVYTVQAEFNFKGSNNDELCFKKGDIITVTQKEDGGWWEGTLDDKTGWFPSNYVKEYKQGAPNVVDTIRPPEEIAQFRSVVFNDLLESEKAHVAELRGMVENFLEPLQESQILTKDEYAQLMCNFIEVVEAHEDLYQCLEDCNDRVGKIFLSKAPTLKSVHQTYCASHPRAIVIVDKHKEALNNYMEREGAAKPGILVLTTGLSKPFRRLDKYSAILQELERHMELSHPDRGDTQRSIAVYKDLAATCIATRRQKELELQILTGPVRGWQGQELSSLGEIIHMGSVAVGADFRDRYFVLFPQTLLILSVSQRMSAFKYEGKLPLSGIMVNRLQDSDQVKNAFEISGPLIERITVVCQGPSEANKWVELLSSNNPSETTKRRTGMELKRNISAGSMTGGGAPVPPPHFIDSRGYSLCSFNINSLLSNDRVTYPPASYPSTAPYAQLTNYFRELVRDGTLSRFIVKALLYPEFLRDFDISEVKMRRKHKSKKKLKRHHRKESWFVTESSSDDEEDGTDEDPEGSQIFRSSSASSNESEECEECEEEAKNLSESCDDCSTFGLVQYYTGKKSSASTELTDYESFIDHGAQTEEVVDEFFISAPFCDTPTSQVSHVDVSVGTDDRESLLFGSCTTKVTEITPRTSQSPIHTSTARMNLAAIKQQESQMSSFEHQLGGHMACEDLLNVDEEMQIKNCLKPKPIIETRHSMPMYFVGNRFNTSSKTEIYIPTWKDKQESRDRSKETSKKDSISTENRHSNARQDEDCITEAERDDAFTPPDMFRNDEVTNPPVFSLSREATPFKKHSINSDKRMSSHSTQGQKGPSRPESLLTPHEERLECTTLNYTPRSSDSGMAGSCTISSPLYDLMSPPLTEVTIHPEPYTIIKDPNNNDSGQYESASLKTVHEKDTQRHTTSELVLNVGRDHVDPSNNNKNQAKNNVIIIKQESSSDTGNQTIYRTGLYAHWWKKETLPNQMITGIVSDKTEATTLITKPNYRDIKQTSCTTKDTSKSHESRMKDEKNDLNNDRDQNNQHSCRKPMKITVVRKKGSGKQTSFRVNFLCAEL